MIRSLSLVSLLSLVPSLAACGGPREAPSTPVVDPPRGEATPRSEVASSTAPALAPEAETTPPPDPLAPLWALTGSESTSLGGPGDGRLEGGVALPESGPGLRSNPRRPNTEGYFGTVEVVHAVVRAAGIVAEELPGGQVTINDLGFAEGGPIPRHGSHQSGRDVDALFYLLDTEGAPREGKGVPIDPSGEGIDFADLADPTDDVDVRIDLPRTWRFVQALLEAERATVQRIFVAEHLRTMLLTHARSVSAPPGVIARFEEATCQPGAPHDDHLHIRWFCTPEDVRAGCLDSTPIYPWHRAAMRAEGAPPVLWRPAPRPSSRARTVSPAQALADAGEMHESVVAFLARRESWATKPRTGRPYCR